MNTRTSIHPFRWGDTTDGPKRDGLRINRNGRWLFVPDSDLLDLANNIADHLDRKKTRRDDTTVTAYSTSTTTEGTNR